MYCLENALGTVAANPSPVKNKRVLVLGAGGVARPIVYGLRSRGALVTVASRTKGRSENLAQSFDCKAIDWESRNRALCDVVVNCTPIGMHPNVDESPLSKTSLKPSMLIFDTVYNPESTLLIKDARERNCLVATGVDMFEKQAELQFKLFTKQDAPTGLMREVLKKAIGPLGGGR